MGTGLAPALAETTLLGIRTAVDDGYVQLHVGDPGAAGTANQANDATRQQISYGATVTTGTGTKVIATDTDMLWDAFDSDDATITHWSLWSAATAGTFLVSGSLSVSVAVSDGAPVRIPAGEFTLTTSTAS